MLEKVYQDRLAKLEKIKALGVDPYGRRHDSAEAIAAVLGRFDEDEGARAAEICGRTVLLRDMGKLIFAQLRDETGTMQIALRKNALGETEWALAKLLDLGDILAVRGPVVRTRTGEVTVFAEGLALQCKSLLPLPEKYHGLQDVELRYRQRYLDLIVNPESMETFRKRVAIVRHFRRYLEDRGFLEVETPMMQSLCGGAAARPFTTHHNALGLDLYLRISPELYLKRLLVGGMGKVFEINRNFRNEGIDSTHNPEFTMMELYQAGADYEVMMELTEGVIASAAEMVWREYLAAGAEGAAAAIDDAARRGIEAEPLAEMKRAAAPLQEAHRQWKNGKTILPFGDLAIDFTPPWRRATYEELLAEHAGVPLRDPEAIRAKARELGIAESNKADAVVANLLFEALVEPHLIQPTLVTDYPADLCPLTRRHPDDPSLALRFEAYAATMELANAYTELNDPVVQEANFTRQLAGEAADETMRTMDEDFVSALRHGMPPAGGLGIGIDRVVMLLTGKTSIRDVVLFPTLRPQE